MAHRQKMPFFLFAVCTNESYEISKSLPAVKALRLGIYVHFFVILSIKAGSRALLTFGLALKNTPHQY